MTMPFKSAFQKISNSFITRSALLITQYSLLVVSAPLLGVGADALLGAPPESPKIAVNNRILARINGASISTHDVMKKMDIQFYQQFPEYTSSIPARFQYYQVNWKATLDELIDKELVLADASENKVEVTSGDVRQEMEDLFGPNIIANLHKVGMTFDEAAKIVKGDIMIQRMLGARVHGKAYRMVTPAMIKNTYEQYIQDPKHARPSVWRYRVISIRDRNSQKAEAVGDAAYRLLSEEAIPLDKLVDTLQERKLMTRKTKVNISEEIENNEKEIAESYKEALSPLAVGGYSTPSTHKSRNDEKEVTRIFYLVDMKPGGMPTFRELESKIKNKLLNDSINSESDLYIQKLRLYFHADDHKISDDFQPFNLK